MGGIRLAEGGVHADALVEDKAFAVVVGTPAVFEVFQDASIELMDVPKALAFHVGPRLFAAYAAGAKHHHRLVFEGFGKFGDRLGKIPEMVDARRARAAKCPEFDFVVVAGVEERDLAALVEPLLEGGGGQLGRSSAGWVDAFDTESDDLFLDPHQHSREGLVFTQADLRSQILKAGKLAQGTKERLDAGRRAGHEKVDAFGAQENRAFEALLPAQTHESLAEWLEIAQFGEAIGGDVGDLL